MARTSRVSSGSTSLVPLGIGWIMGLGAVSLALARSSLAIQSDRDDDMRRGGGALLPKRPAPCARGGIEQKSNGALRVHRLCGDSLDASAKLAQTLVDALVAAVDLTDVADLATSLRAQRCEQHRHAGANVRRLHALTAQAARAGDDRPVRVAHHDVRAHQDQLVGEDKTVLEHPLVDQD